MNNELRFENYKKSLEQKYNAICFDIDGTLTSKNSKNIDSRAIKMIAKLLEYKIPVVFITGRGETGLIDLKNDIYEPLKKHNTDVDLKRVYVLTNDGARLFYSENVLKEDFLKQNIYITTKNELDELLKINNYIIDLNKNLKYSKFFKIKYSKDLISNIIINIRLIFDNVDNNIINFVFNNIKNIIKDNNYNNICITRGIYKNINVIQIGTTTKDKAIEITEKIIGVPKNSMMRVGDCGDIYGNDYLMLNCSQGYSVNKTSNDENACFPIFDDNKNILKGIDATLYLIQKAKLLSTVCLEKADKKNYTYNFAMIEKNIVLGRKKLLNKYNNIVNQNFNDINGIDSLFDKESGSIKIPMYEWEILKNNPLKEFWGSCSNEILEYSIRDDNNYLLRGSNTYYYFLANRNSINNRDITSKIDIINWHNNYLKFLSDALIATEKVSSVNSIVNKKFILGILDNCRNILLILLNHKLFSNYFNKNIILDISSNENNNIFNLYSALFKIEYLMSSICFKINYTINIEEIKESISITHQNLEANLKIEINSNVKENYSKDYRAYREIDNFGENYVAVSLYSDKCNKKRNYINSCGLSYAGIELPIIAKIINQNQIEKILLLKFNKDVSGYSNKQLIDLRKFNINDFGGIIGINKVSNSNLDLFDDNILTGKTLQLAINSLYDFNIKVNNICIVRYPSINRIDQMFIDNTSAVDYRLFFDYIYGLCFSSPYSWKDNEWKNNIGKINYNDTLGIFDLNRKKIIECLIKNHNFKENSEVGEYKRRLVK